MVDHHLLEGIPLFEGLSEEERSLLARYLSERRYGHGETVFIEQAAGQRLYIIREGSVRIIKRVAENESLTLAVLKPGNFFGELSLLTGEPHTATVETLRDSHLLTLGRTEFEDLLVKKPKLGYQVLLKLSQTICKLLRQMDNKFVDIMKFVWEFGAKL